MKVCFISDTHSFHREFQIPEADVIVCCGDISLKGELSIIEDFANWMKELPIKHKICIFGNHELGMKNGPKRIKALSFLKDAGIHYLENSSVVINGIKFYGSPATPHFHNWEWNYFRGKDIQAEWNKIDTDTNVLITHGPAYSILDKDLHGNSVGCQNLLDHIVYKIPELQVHSFGHIHESYGQFDFQNVKCINASSCNRQYQPVNPPIVMEI